MTRRSDADYQRAYRDRQRGRPARTLKPCGTYAAAMRHRRHGEPLCPACKRASADYARDYQQRRREARNGPAKRSAKP